MRYALVVLFALPCLVFPSEPTAADHARAALALAQAPSPPQAPSLEVKDECSCSPCTCDPCLCGVTYKEAYMAAMRKQVPLYVFVGQKAKVVPGGISCSVTRLGDAMPGSVVVSVPSEGDLLWIATIPGMPSVQKIQEAIQSYKEKTRVPPMATASTVKQSFIVQPMRYSPPSASFTWSRNCGPSG